MQPHNWTDTSDGVLGCLIGQPGRSKTPLLLLFNPQASDRSFVLPAGSWRILLDTARNEVGDALRQDAASYPLLSHSVALLQWEPGDA
jgi:pullulanase/glycogen debranching enzyme